MLKTGLVVVILIMMSLISTGQTLSDTLNRVNEDGLKMGYWKKYNENRLLVYEGRFMQDIPIGDFIYYYPDGRVKAKSFFYNDGTQTKTSTYHYSGKLMTEGFYLDKKKDSLWFLTLMLLARLYAKYRRELKLLCLFL